MTKTIIHEKNIANDFQPELVLVMTYVKNNWQIKALQNLNFYEVFT